MKTTVYVTDPNEEVDVDLFRECPMHALESFVEKGQATKYSLRQFEVEFNVGNISDLSYIRFSEEWEDNE